MARSYRSAVIPAPVERVWSVVRDFDGMPLWHPAIASSEIEDARPAAEVGCVRHLSLPDGATIRERLVALDEPGRSCTYEILDGPFPIRSYRAVIRVAPITGSGETFVEWYGDYDPETAGPEAERQLEETFGDTVYAPGLSGLRKHFEQ